MSEEPTDATPNHDLADRPRSSGLRGLAERHPTIVILLIVFGGLGGLIALQMCTS